MKQTHLSWDDIEDYCKKLADMIKRSDFKPEIIVGIQRGGCVTAVLLSHLLNIEDFCTIGIRSTKSDEIRAQRVKPIIYDSFSLQLISGKKILLTDDITDTGVTLIEAKKELIKYGYKEVKSATIVRAPASNGKVDFYAKEIKPWVVFPWESKI
ncbi:MAG: phosphoribosyltransferase [Candidatus Neomarinimicrobiota bacterium]